MKEIYEYSLTKNLQEHDDFFVFQRQSSGITYKTPLNSLIFNKVFLYQKLEARTGIQIEFKNNQHTIGNIATLDSLQLIAGGGIHIVGKTPNFEIFNTDGTSSLYLHDSFGIGITKIDDFNYIIENCDKGSSVIIDHIIPGRNVTVHKIGYTYQIAMTVKNGLPGQRGHKGEKGPTYRSDTGEHKDLIGPRGPEGPPGPMGPAGSPGPIISVTQTTTHTVTVTRTVTRYIQPTPTSTPAASSTPSASRVAGCLYQPNTNIPLGGTPPNCTPDPISVAIPASLNGKVIRATVLLTVSNPNLSCGFSLRYNNQNLNETSYNSNNSPHSFVSLPFQYTGSGCFTFSYGCTVISPSLGYCLSGTVRITFTETSTAITPTPTPTRSSSVAAAPCQAKFAEPVTDLHTFFRGTTYVAYGITAYNNFSWTSATWLDYLRNFMVGRVGSIGITNNILQLVYAQYIKPIAQNGVGRLPDYMGLEYWCIELAKGRLTSSTLVTAFSTQPEVVIGKSLNRTTRTIVGLNCKTAITALACHQKFTDPSFAGPGQRTYGLTNYRYLTWSDPTWLEYLRGYIRTRTGITATNAVMLTVVNQYGKNIQNGGAGRLPEYDGFEWWVRNITNGQYTIGSTFEQSFQMAQEIVTNRAAGMTFQTVTERICTDSIGSKQPIAVTTTPSQTATRSRLPNSTPTATQTRLPNPTPTATRSRLPNSTPTATRSRLPNSTPTATRSRLPNPTPTATRSRLPVIVVPPTPSAIAVTDNMIFLGANRMRAGSWSETIDGSPLDPNKDYFIIIWYQPYPRGGVINGTITIPGIGSQPGFYTTQGSNSYVISNDYGGAQHFPFRGRNPGMRIDLSVSGFNSTHIKGQFIIAPGYPENRNS